MTTQITRQSGRSPRPQPQEPTITRCHLWGHLQYPTTLLVTPDVIVPPSLQAAGRGPRGTCREGRALPSHLLIAPALLPPSPGTTYFSSGHSGLPLNPPQPREYSGRSFYKEGRRKCPIFVLSKPGPQTPPLWRAGSRYRTLDDNSSRWSLPFSSTHTEDGRPTHHSRLLDWPEDGKHCIGIPLVRTWSWERTCESER